MTLTHVFQLGAKHFSVYTKTFELTSNVLPRVIYDN